MKKLLIATTLLLFATDLSAQWRVDMDIAGGVGFAFLGEEAETFDTDSLFGSFHWNGFKLPWLEASTGVGIEFHPTTIDIAGSKLEGIDYRIWSLNRFDCPAALYCGADVQIGKGGDGGWVADGDVRAVFGTRIAGIADTAQEVNVEFYLLQNDRPIGFAIIYRWGGSNN